MILTPHGYTNVLDATWESHNFRILAMDMFGNHTTSPDYPADFGNTSSTIVPEDALNLPRHPPSLPAEDTYTWMWVFVIAFVVAVILVFTFAAIRFGILAVHRCKHRQETPVSSGKHAIS